MPEPTDNNNPIAINKTPKKTTGPTNKIFDPNQDGVSKMLDRRENKTCNDEQENSPPVDDSGKNVPEGTQKIVLLSPPRKSLLTSHRSKA